MSEWGIEQHSTLHSTFGNAGGCFVEGVSFVGAIVIIVGLIHLGKTQDNPQMKGENQPKIETAKQDSTVSLPDTITFNATAYQR